MNEYGLSESSCGVEKTTIVPIPKKTIAKEMNDFRPVSLTPLLMKCFERIMKDFIMNYTSHGHGHDQLQFAYSRNGSVADATLILLHFFYINI